MNLLKLQCHLNSALEHGFIVTTIMPKQIQANLVINGILVVNYSIYAPYTKTLPSEKI